MKIKGITHNGEYDVVIANECVQILCNSLLKPRTNEITTLYCFMAKNILFSNLKSFILVKNQHEFYGYKLNAKIKDINKKVVEFFDLDIILDCSLPGDLENGQYIEFEVLRLDIITK